MFPFLKNAPLFPYIQSRAIKISPRYYPLILFIVCLLAYWPVFSHKFQFYWDDQWVVMNDYTESGINVENVVAILTEFYHGQYAPVNEFFYLALYSLFGYNSFWFHTASLCVHIANVLLVFSLIKKLLLAGSRFSSGSITRISLVTAVLLAIHPMMVESVSWMAASKCILFALFYLIALHTYLNYLATKRAVYYWLTVLFFVISFGAKEQAVTMPLCLMLLDFVMNRDLKKADIWFEKLPFFCLSICFGIVTFYSQAFNGEGVLSQEAHYPVYQDLIFGTYTVIEYVIKIILPLRLNYIYPFPNLPGEPLPFHLWLYPILLVALTATFWRFWTKKWIFFGVVFFLIQISIVSNVLPTARFAILADRYVYLPSIGIFFLMAYLLDMAMQKRKQFGSMILPGFLIYLTCLGIYARQRVCVWHDSFTLKKELKQNIHDRSDYKKWLETQGLK